MNRIQQNHDSSVTCLSSSYRKLLDPGLGSCSRQSMFLNLLYKSLKADVVLRRIKAFIKRLLQVSCQQNATFACGALFLVSEVMKAKPGLRLLLQDNEVRSHSSTRRGRVKGHISDSRPKHK